MADWAAAQEYLDKQSKLSEQRPNWIAAQNYLDSQSPETNPQLPLISRTAYSILNSPSNIPGNPLSFISQVGKDLGTGVYNKYQQYRSDPAAIGEDVGAGLGMMATAPVALPAAYVNPWHAAKMGAIGAGLGGAAGRWVGREIESKMGLPMTGPVPLQSGLLDTAGGALGAGLLQYGKNLFNQSMYGNLINIARPEAAQFERDVQSAVPRYYKTLQDNFDSWIQEAPNQYGNRKIDLTNTVNDINEARLGGATPSSGGRTSSGLHLSDAEYKSLLAKVPQDQLAQSAQGAGDITLRNPRVASEINAAMKNFERAHLGGKPGVLREFLADPSLAENATPAQAQEIANTLKMAPSGAGKFGNTPYLNDVASQIAHHWQNVRSAIADAYPEINPVRRVYAQGMKKIEDVKEFLSEPIVPQLRGRNDLFQSPLLSQTAQEVVGPDLWQNILGARGQANIPGEKDIGPYLGKTLVRRGIWFIR